MTLVYYFEYEHSALTPLAIMMNLLPEATYEQHATKQSLLPLLYLLSSSQPCRFGDEHLRHKIIRFALPLALPHGMPSYQTNHYQNGNVLLSLHVRMQSVQKLV